MRRLAVASRLNRCLLVAAPSGQQCRGAAAAMVPDTTVAAARATAATARNLVSKAHPADAPSAQPVADSGSSSDLNVSPAAAALLEREARAAAHKCVPSLARRHVSCCVSCCALC